MNYEYELYHHGVKGMKWGVRKKRDPKVEAARQQYKSAKKEYRNAERTVSRAAYTSFGMKGLSNYRKLQDDRNNAQLKALDAKVNYKKSKAKTAEKANKAEFNTYKRALGKNGLPGSAADEASKGQSTRIYDSIAAKKGKAYADKVAKRVQNEAVATLVGSAVVAVGAAYVSAHS